MSNTVESLRKAGYRVKIRHLRRIKYIEGLKIKEILASRREAMEKYNLHNSEVIAGMQAKGGRTEAHLEAPDGFCCFGVAYCMEEDSYNRATGRTLALINAAEQLVFRE